MAKKHMQKCSMSLVFRDKQIKTTMRYFFQNIRMARIKETDSIKY